MQTLSVHLTDVSIEDNCLCYYDDFSFIIMQTVQKILKLNSESDIKNVRIVNLTDIYGSEKSKNIEEIISLYKDKKDTVIIALVEISDIEFNKGEVCTEEKVKEMTESLIRDIKIMKNLGFIEMDLEKIINTSDSFAFVYPNEYGLAVFDYISNYLAEAENNEIEE